MDIKKLIKQHKEFGRRFDKHMDKLEALIKDINKRAKKLERRAKRKKSK